MKRNLILTVLALSLTLTAVAQPKGKECQDVDKKELQAKMMKMKKPTFTQNLKLTKEESETKKALVEELKKFLCNNVKRQRRIHKRKMPARDPFQPCRRKGGKIRLRLFQRGGFVPVPLDKQHLVLYLARALAQILVDYFFITFFHYGR